MFFQNINYVAVVVAAVAAVVIGFLWYSPWAFGAKWIRSKGVTAESMKNKPMPLVWLSTIVFAFITAFVLAALFNSLIVVGTWGIIIAAVLIWVAFTAKVKVSDYTFGGEPLAAILISTGYELVATVAMALIIGFWK